MEKLIWSWALFLAPFWGISRDNILSIGSPDKRIEATFKCTGGALVYRVAFAGVPILQDSRLDLTDAHYPVIPPKVTILKYQKRRGKEKYELPVGKTSRVSDRYNELWLELTGGLVIRIRVFNEGVAFRYEFPARPGLQTLELTEERSEFHFEGNPQMFGLYRDHFTSSHEGFYTAVHLDEIPEGQLVDMPALFRFSDRLFVAVTEAALRNYAGMYLKKSEGSTLVSQLSPLPGQKGLKVSARLPHRSPWRVILIADQVGQLIESNLLTSLNEPCMFTDISWIQPGKTDWTWWHGDTIPDPDFTPGLNNETQEYYIDFCAENGIEYHAVVEYGNHSWYHCDGEGFDPPPPGADVTRPVESLNMDRLAEYSRQKGVGLRVWVHWKPLSEKLDQAFAQFQQWNIKGLMVDFMDRDDQEMVNWQEKVLQTAAKYQLHVQFHGAYKPTGLIRTYPNEFTREGVLNLEALKWSGDCDPEHNLMIPFTRMLAGPTDYHSGGFRSAPKAQYEATFRAPRVLGTRCHHLGLFVVFENYLPMLADYPAAYLGQPGFEFLQKVPATWDETRVLTGEIGDFIVIARRKGSEWFIGAMTDWTARELEIPLGFLPKGNFQAEVYQDAPDADLHPDLLEKKMMQLTRSDKLRIKMAPGGGLAARIVFR